MRKVVISEFVSLDGVIENPMWTFNFMSPERERYKFDELRAADALLLGRVTYRAFADAWPKMAEQTGEYGAMMNGYPKYVASATLATLDPGEWNGSLIGGDLATAIAELKAQPGRDILVFGSGKLAESLIRDNLVDEYRLMVFPILLGSGQRLFTEGLAATLELIEAQPLPAGVVILTYRPAAQAGG